jgi:hypothetical protein
MNCVTVWLALHGLPATAAEDLPGDRPPSGFHLVAEDDCGSPQQTHVVVGTAWTYPESMVQADGPYRTLVFDNQECLLRYRDPNPAAGYKVDVVYLDNGGRVQRLEANGHEVHGNLSLPVGRPRRYVYEVPRAAYADGKTLDLRFIKVAGANAIVSYVRIWSTERTPLGAPPAEQRAAFHPPAAATAKPIIPPKPLWPTSGPIEEDWTLEDEAYCRPVAARWEAPADAITSRVIPSVQRQLQRGAILMADLPRLGVTDLGADAARLAEAAAACQSLIRAKSADAEAWKKVYFQTRWAVRRMALANPLLHQGAGLLFVRRHHPHFAHQCARRRAAASGIGGEICLLREVRPDNSGEIVRLTQGKFPDGVFGRPDVSFDGRRIVFGFGPKLGAGAAQHPLARHREDGPCGYFQIWEMTLDGRSAPRQLTDDGNACENADPLYLPDGRIAFMSERQGGLVQCGDWALSYCLHTMDPDGAEVRQVTWAKDGEWDPSLMDDGTVLFTRWEYVMRFWGPTQLLWSVRPDGTNPRVIGGYLLGERNYAMCRQVPGRSKVVCIDSGHHNDGSGSVLVVDLNYGRDSVAGVRTMAAGRFDCPYPLNENYILVAHAPRTDRPAGTTDYGIYLLDAWGGRELLYRDPQLSAMFPMPLRPRPRPGLVAATAEPAVGEFGEFFVADVHQGLPEQVRGKARHLRIVEAHERHLLTLPWNVEVGIDSGFETKTVLGTVPVEADGSAYFRVPAGKAVFFAVLDENYQALHVMRMTTTVRPGERTGCVGCHEPMGRAPPRDRLPQAALRPASTIQPPPWGLRALGFPELVQPVLDRHCTRCHDGARGPEKSFDLTAPKSASLALEKWYSDKMYQDKTSYVQLRRYVKHAPIHQYYTPPLAWGSRVSPLMDVLAKGHYGVTLGRDQWQALAAWIDCNAPYLDDFRKLAADPAQRLASGPSP